MCEIAQGKHNMNKYLFAILALLLVGCSSNPKVPDKVYIPVKTPCITEKPVKPILADLKPLSASDYVLTITSDYLKLLNYSGELEAVVAGCE